MESRNWTIGQSVVVKPGVTDPDTGNDISGWQGRIRAFYDEEATLAILWDSLTLKSMSPKHIAWCEEEGLSWTEMNLSVEEVEPVAARDTEKDVTATIKEIESKTGWLYLGGEQGKRIQQIVNRAKGRDEFAASRTWPGRYTWNRAGGISKSSGGTLALSLDLYCSVTSSSRGP